jgi:hypothetical protein
MSNSKTPVLMIIHVITWIVFVGLCIKAGALAISFFISLAINAAASQDLYLGLNLSRVAEYSTGHYIAVVSLLFYLTVTKAQIAYLVIKLLGKFDLESPFADGALPEYFFKISHIALTAGVIAIIGKGYIKWLAKAGVPAPVSLGGEEILFFAGVIYILAIVFKKGTALQNEADLTV